MTFVRLAAKEAPERTVSRVAFTVVACLVGILGVEGSAVAGGASVVDAAGKKLGTLVGSPDGDVCPANTLMKQGRALVALGIRRAGVVSCSVPVFLFDTADCSGTRYLEVTDFDLARRCGAPRV